MSDHSRTDVLIVGAGPTGLTLALQLRRIGVECRIIDKNDAPSKTSKAIGLQYRVSELLTWMGLIDRFEARAAQTDSVNLYVDNVRVLVLRLDTLPNTSGAGAFTPRPIILPQSETEAILGDALREHDCDVEWSTTFVRFTQDSDRVLAVVRTSGGDETIDCEYLVSCEGAHSTIRKQAGISFAGKAYPHDFVMADVELDWTHRHEDSHAWLHPDGMLSTIALRGERRWRLFIEAGPGDGTIDEVTLERVQALLAERTGDHTTRATNPTWLTRFKLHSRIVDRFSRGRVFLAGDAAHLHSPSGGQGITTGMQDAFNLAWKLGMVLRDGASRMLLETYSEERLPIARAVLRTTDRNTNLLFANTRVGQFVRNRIAFPLLNLRWVQGRMVAKLSQLDQRYRRQSLSWARRSLWRRTTLRAGDRAPDVLFGVEGSSLFALLGTRFVALVTGDVSPALSDGFGRLGIEAHSVSLVADPKATTDLVDVTGEFRRLYGARDGEVWLIRPDGYVGLCCPSDRLDVVKSYLMGLWSAKAIAGAFREERSKSPKSRSTWVASHRLAQIGICIQFLAVIRTIGEFFRLQRTQGPSLAVTSVEPFIAAGLLAAVLTWMGVLCYFAGRDRATVWVAGLTIAALLMVKIAIPS
jgi:2-polyprenyl-6-methoxyphenol hydroxylase-like FAD-dependent oxidoreductase